MPSIYELKPAFQRLLRPMVAGLARLGVTANAVTVVAFLLSAAEGAWIALAPGSPAPLLALPVVLAVRMALNAVDGMLAREHGMKSRLGALLNELGDVASDAALYLPLAWVPGLRPPLVVTVVVLGALAELAGVAAATVGASRRYDGPLGKSDRAFAFGALALALGLGAPPGRWSDAFLATLVVLAAITPALRARRALAEAPGDPPADPPTDPPAGG